MVKLLSLGWGTLAGAESVPCKSASTFTLPSSPRATDGDLCSFSLLSSLPPRFLIHHLPLFLCLALCLLFILFFGSPFYFSSPSFAALVFSLLCSWRLGSHPTPIPSSSPPPPPLPFPMEYIHKYIYTYFFLSVFLLVVSAYLRLLGFACFAAGFDAVVRRWWMTIIV